MNITQRKSLQRKKIQKKFESLLDSEISLHSKIVCQYITSFIESESFKNIGVYISINSEVNLNILMNDLNYNFYAPAFNKTTRDYNFILLDKKTDVVMGKFNIPEPQGKLIDTNQIDVILVPGIAFDDKGNRLGRGKGYYDKILKNYKGKTVGICHSLQIINNVPISDWDISVDYICTEKKLFKTNKD